MFGNKNIIFDPITDSSKSSIRIPNYKYWEQFEKEEVAIEHVAKARVDSKPDEDEIAKLTNLAKNSNK